jgi:benzoyl-CoA reductase/2-hydroxyglutaryl-CoA dehydratase subunit BcrC/BadD/HgdB
MAILDRARLESLRLERIEELRGLKAQGKKVVGYFCLYAPFEIVQAAGAIPVRLARADYQSALAGERFLRADACPFCKASLGKFVHDPLYRLVDGVVIVNTCDMMRRLPEALTSNYSVPVFLLYLPRTSELFPNRLQEFQAGLRDLKAWLGGLTGQKWQEERLREAIDEANQLRRRLQELDQTRAEMPPPISGSELFDIVALATLLPPKRMLNLLNELLAVRRTQAGAVNKNRARLLLTGSILSEEDRTLIEIVEEKADIVADTVCTGSRWFNEAITVEEEPFAGLARFYFSRTPCACRRPNTALFEYIKQQVTARKVQGIVSKSLLYCDAYRFEVKQLRQEVGLPVLEVDGDYSQVNRQQLRTRVEAFLEMLR